MNSHIIIDNGRYYAVTGIQDGTERSGPLGSLDAALTWCKECEKVMNGNKVKKKNIPVYEKVTPPTAATFKRIQ